MENMEKVVYLDNAATTPCAPEALEMMVKALSGACGNPSSHYSVGYEAKEFVDTGRAQVAKAINASPAELFFTSCGSEADNWAVKGTAFTKARQNKKHLITSAFEHHAIMHSMAALERMGFEVTYIKPTAEGYIRPEDVEAAIRPDTALVSTPHQFFSQGREVTLVALLHNLDAMRSLADDKAGFLRHTLTTTINGYQIVVAATLDIERDDCRIVDDDRTDVQTVRSHRSKTDATTLRNDDRSAIR